MEILITEHKSVGQLKPIETSVRVFVDNDLNYGYFVPEHTLWGLLDADQQKHYLEGEEARLNVPTEVAQKIIDAGVTPYKKPQLR